MSSDQLSVFEQLNFSTIRVETEGPAGRGTGIGFFYRAELQGKGVHVPIIVTNRHVAEGATIIRLRFTCRG
jgi:hypothetical protein